MYLGNPFEKIVNTQYIKNISRAPDARKAGYTYNAVPPSPTIPPEPLSCTHPPTIYTHATTPLSSEQRGGRGGVVENSSPHVALTAAAAAADRSRPGAAAAFVVRHDCVAAHRRRVHFVTPCGRRHPYQPPSPRPRPATPHTSRGGQRVLLCVYICAREACHPRGDLGWRW